MFKKLFNFDEVCFEGAVVEEERRVGPGGQVFELSWLPGERGRQKMEERWGRMWRHRTYEMHSYSSFNQTVIKCVKTESTLVIEAVRTKCCPVD